MGMCQVCGSKERETVTCRWEHQDSGIIVGDERIECCYQCAKMQHAGIDKFTEYLHTERRKNGLSD